MRQALSNIINPSFVNEETEAQGGSMTCPKSHSSGRTQAGWLFITRPVAFTSTTFMQSSPGRQEGEEKVC